MIQYRTYMWWLLLSMLCLATPAWAQQVQLNNVRISATPDRTRVVFDLSGGVDSRLFMLSKPARLVIDLPQTRKAGEHPGEWGGKGIVKRFRTGVHEKTGLRIVLDLAQADVESSSFVLPGSQGSGRRLVVDLTAADGAESGGQPSSDKARSAPVTADSDTGNKSSQTVYRPASPMQKIVVAVDAGHGGHDPGAIGPHGIKEKNVTLAMAKRLAAMIDEQPNMHAVLTRKSDTYVGLRQRTRIARKADADLFVSIHANASTSASPHGVAVYALSLDGATSEHARLLAQRENTAVTVGNVDLEGKDANVASFMLDLAQSATIEASLDLAQRVLGDLGQFTTKIRSGVEQAAFVVLKSPDIPSILVETGFITNPTEERKLNSATYQSRVVRAILQGIKGYCDSYRPGTMVASGQVHEVAAGETLSGIAAKYHVSLSRLREYNDIRGNVIRVGQKLRIPPPGHQQVASR